MQKSKRGLSIGLLTLLLGGCAGLQDIVQGSIDQAAKGNSAMRIEGSFQVPEDALVVRDPQLTKTLHRLGHLLARGYRPKSRVILVAANRADADWLTAGIHAGIRQTGWAPEAVMWPVQFQLSNAYPRITVMENAPEVQVQRRTDYRGGVRSNQPRPLTEPIRGLHSPALANQSILDPVSPESREHLATLQTDFSEKAP